MVKGRGLFFLLFFPFYPRAISHIYARFRVNKKDKHERRISRVPVIFTSGGERLRRETREGRGAGFRSRRPEYRIVSGALMKLLSHDAAGGGTFYYYLIASRY